MRVVFQSLVLSNFKAFLGRHTLALDGGGVVFVVGENERAKRLSSNGASKSTLWDAVTWCLYGRTPMGLRNPDIVPWSGKGKPFVAVGLKIDDVDHLVERGMSPNRFSIDGKEAPDILSLLPISFELFVNTILLPQDQDLFFDRTPKDKMILFSETLQLGRWDIRSEAASDVAKTYEDKISVFIDEQRTTEGALEELDWQLEDTRERARSWADTAHRKVTASKAAISELQRKLERQDKALGGAILKEDGALTELRHSEGEVRKLTGELLGWQKKLATRRAELKVSTEQVEDLADEAAELTKARSCPTCGQPVTPKNLEKHKAHLRTRLAGLERDILAGQKEIASMASAEKKSAQRLEQFEAGLIGFRKTANEASDVITRLRPEVAELKLRIEEATKTKDEINPYIQQVGELSSRRKLLLKDLEAIKADVAKAQQGAERNRFWVKAFKDIKLQLIEEVLQELELVTNSMIEEVGLEDWQVKLDIEKESKSGTIKPMINVQINSPESKGYVRWESWSGGERQRLRLIGSLALADVLLAHVGVETNLEVLDEPAVYWSSEGVQELCAFLATRSRERKKDIWYIEHNAVESVHFDEVIRVIKDKDGAYIEATR